ncbi:MAG: response regulator [Desulfobacterales bacterium]|nr:response regulator [Desulfobacterales bacterium]
MDPAHRSQHTLLLVEDEVRVLNALRRTLRPLGHEVVTALSGQEGLDLLKNLDPAPALIISDLRMPGMNGTEFLEQAKELAPETIRYMLSGYADMDAVIDSINRGEVQRFLTKPWEEKNLLFEVTEGLKQYELTQKNHRLMAHIRRQNQRLYQFGQEMDNLVKERTRKLEGYLVQTLRSLATLADMGEAQMKGHGQRVGSLARDIASALELSDETIVQVEVAGLLHDIGKIGIPHHLRQEEDLKPDRPEERELYQSHPRHGARLLENLPPFHEAASFIELHHERLDGSGFPDGLQGDAIPLGAQIIGLADTVDMLCHRPEAKSSRLTALFRKELPQSKPHLVVEMLRESATHLFPVKLLDALVRAFKPEIPSEFSLPMNSLEEGMVVSRPLYTRSKRLIIPQGTPLTTELIQKLNKLSRQNKIENTAHVLREFPEDSYPHP